MHPHEEPPGGGIPELLTVDDVAFGPRQVTGYGVHYADSIVTSQRQDMIVNDCGHCDALR
jgi:hypothetical protein